MSYFFLGCAILAGLLLLGRLILHADPKKLAGVLRKFGAVVLFALAGFLALRGAFPIAIPMAAVALGLLGGRKFFGGGSPLSGGGFGGSAQPSQGQASTVRTERLEMQLDHDSGHMDGVCLTGKFDGRKLSSLSDREVLELYLSFEEDRLKEADLLEAYLNWRLPDWQDQAEQAKEHTGSRGFSKDSMSLEEARAVLDVTASATEAEIRTAHRNLMKKVHPDQGGSTYLAARINEAKEVLLGR